MSGVLTTVDGLIKKRIGGGSGGGGEGTGLSPRLGFGRSDCCEIGGGDDGNWLRFGRRGNDRDAQTGGQWVGERGVGAGREWHFAQAEGGGGLSGAIDQVDQLKPGEALIVADGLDGDFPDGEVGGRREIGFGPGQFLLGEGAVLKDSIDVFLAGDFNEFRLRGRARGRGALDAHHIASGGTDSKEGFERVFFDKHAVEGVGRRESRGYRER